MNEPNEHQSGDSKESIDEWGALPIMLTVKDAASVLRIGRSKAYEMAATYTSTGGTQGLPVIRLGDLLRIPKVALHEFVTTGRVVQLIPQQHENATPSQRPARKPGANAQAQRSLLESD